MLLRRGGYSEEAGAEFKTESRILNRNKSVTRWPVPQWLCKSCSRDRKAFDTWAGFCSWTLGQFSASGHYKKKKKKKRKRKKERRFGGPCTRARTRTHTLAQEVTRKVAVAADRRRGKPAQDETRMTRGQRTRIHNDTPSSEQASCLDKNEWTLFSRGITSTASTWPSLSSKNVSVAR